MQEQATRRRSHRERGQSLVEFALAMPLFVLLLAFALEGGRLMAMWISVNNATREAARVAALPIKTNADARSAAKAFLFPIAGPGIVNDGTDNTTSDIKIYCREYVTTCTSSCSSAWTSYTDCTTRKSGQEVIVTVAFRFDPLPIFTSGIQWVNPAWTAFTLQAESRAYAE